MTLQAMLNPEEFRELRSLRDELESGPTPQEREVTDELHERWANEAETNVLCA